MLRSLTLLGSSSGRNAGDAALIAGLMEAVDAACGEGCLYEIPTLRPEYIRRHYEGCTTRPVSMMPWRGALRMLGVPTYRSIMRTDLTLVFDAILFDRSLYNPLFNFLSTLYLLLPHAKRRGRRMACYDVGVGPVRTAQGRRMLVEIAEQMDFITVRDEDSLAILRDVGVRNPNVVLGADAALNLRAVSRRRSDEILRGVGFEGLGEDGEFLAVNVNRYLDSWSDVRAPGPAPMTRQRFVETYARALDRVASQLGVPILFVTTQHHDVSITAEVMAAMTSSVPRSLLTNVDCGHHDVKGALTRASLLVGMRLHSLILASSENTPILGLCYQPKVEHYMRSLGLEDHVLSFDRFDAESLAAHVLSGWERRGEIRRQLEGRIPILKQRALGAARLSAALGRGEDLGEAIVRMHSLEPVERTEDSGVPSTPVPPRPS